MAVALSSRCAGDRNTASTMALPCGSLMRLPARPCHRRRTRSTAVIAACVLGVLGVLIMLSSSAIHLTSTPAFPAAGVLRPDQGALAAQDSSCSAGRHRPRDDADLDVLARGVASAGQQADERGPLPGRTRGPPVASFHQVPPSTCR